jgi:acyl carrier protein
MTTLLLETEAIDSLAIFAIVEFLENDFAVEIGEDDLVVDNFTSIMAKMVEVKRGDIGEQTMGPS